MSEVEREKEREKQGEKKERKKVPLRGVTKKRQIPT